MKSEETNPRKPKKENLLQPIYFDSVKFDLTGFEFQKESKESREWRNRFERTELALDIYQQPYRWRFDLTDRDNLADACREEFCDDGEVPSPLIEIEVTSVDGAEALRLLFKNPPTETRKFEVYTSILCIPFETVIAAVHVRSSEYDLVGLRESTIKLLEPELWTKDQTPETGTAVTTDSFPVATTSSPADGERFDCKFPEHPLSIVRSRMAKVIDTIQLAPRLKILQPYRFNKTKSLG